MVNSMTEVVSAAELMARLQADPDFRRKQAEKTARRSANVARLKVEETPLLKDLEVAGWKVDSVWDLVITSKPYPTAIPVLLAHLKRPYSDRIREGIARALAVPDATGAWSTLRTEYEASPEGSGVKSGLAAALAATSTDNVIGELAMIVRNPSNGSSRLLLLNGLRKSHSSVASEALADLKDDPVLAKEIASWRSARLKD